MKDGKKTVNEMPNPDKITAKKIGDASIEPNGPVGKGSLGSANLAGNISASATPKATGQQVQQAPSKEGGSTGQAQGCKGGGMGAP